VSSPYHRSLIAFVDVLGFREAIKSTNAPEPLVAVLQQFADFKGEFGVEYEAIEAGYNATQRPAISVFSDSVAISYPLDVLRQDVGNMDIALGHIQNIIGYFAWNALEAGLLIRGGITIGAVHHEKGVVVGPGLIEAYELEQKVANYPRIAVSPSGIVSELRLDRDTVQIDHDGIPHLQYLEDVVMRTHWNDGRLVGTTDVAPWVRRVTQLLADKTEGHRANNDQRKLAKWNWFSEQWHKTLSTINPELLALGHSKEGI
jgi:hypothetical protein